MPEMAMENDWMGMLEAEELRFVRVMLLSTQLAVQVGVVLMLLPLATAQEEAIELKTIELGKESLILPEEVRASMMVREKVQEVITFTVV